MEIQNGDKDIEAFSFDDELSGKDDQLPCYLTYTNAKHTKLLEII